jgi:hypothetical protein
VFCFKVYRTASEFMRHAESNHKDRTGRRADYIRMTYDELGCRVSSELARSARLIGVKRTWEAAGGALGAQRIKRVAQQDDGIDLLQVLWLC